MITRRRFLAAGVVGAAGLVAAGWLFRARPPAPGRAVLDADAEAIIAAIVPAMLDGALPATAKEREQAIAQAIAGVDAAIAGLPAHARAELAQLFALLALPPSRFALTGITAPWREAARPEVDAFLERFRASPFALLRSAYDALHQLTLAAWYANPRAWTTIGYDGPPRLT